jgi:hypothetical protein
MDTGSNTQGTHHRAAVGGSEVDYLDPATQNALVNNHGRRAKIKRAANRRDRRATRQDLHVIRGMR